MGKDNMLIYTWSEHTKYLTEKYKTAIAGG
jgi:hypothetical protein